MPIEAIEPQRLYRQISDQLRKLMCNGVASALAGDEADRERDTLAEWIAGRGGAVTPRELSRGPRAYRAEGVAEKTLADLVEAGFGRWEWDQPGDGGGRPGRRFVLG